jgi:hypothetical protein
VNHHCAFAPARANCWRRPRQLSFRGQCCRLGGRTANSSASERPQTLLAFANKPRPRLPCSSSRLEAERELVPCIIVVAETPAAIPQSEGGRVSASEIHKMRAPAATTSRAAPWDRNGMRPARMPERRNTGNTQCAQPVAGATTQTQHLSKIKCGSKRAPLTDKSPDSNMTSATERTHDTVRGCCAANNLNRVEHRLTRKLTFSP